MEFKFNVTGAERKKLAGAVSEILNQPAKYLGAPTFAYEIGDYRIDKQGTLTGEYSLSLMAALLGRGFEPEQSETFHLITPRGTLLCQKRYGTREEAEADGYGYYFHHEGRDVYIKPAPDGATEHSKHFAVVGAPFDAPVEQPDDPEDDTSLSIGYPLDGFTPESIDNLTKMVIAKEPLLKKALDTEALPIAVLDDCISFAWFKNDGHADEYAQFIAALCTTAKEKKRVTAKAQETFENEKFAMRVWLIGLGLVGKEYAACRKLLVNDHLGGNSAWRYGAPDKAAPAEQEAEVPGDE